SRGILAAVDASESSARVVSVAAAIAVECGLPLHILSVASSEASRKGAEQNVSINADLARGLGAEVHEMVRIGRPCDEILAVPADIDLIVVGMGDVRSGGTAQKVVGQAEKPVLAVRL
ncbi:MAG: universal stress protein, partial [Burkholderiales bacterium]